MTTDTKDSPDALLLNNMRQLPAAFVEPVFPPITLTSPGALTS